MDDVEALRGADADPAVAVADRMADLELQLSRLTQMVQTGVKLETVGMEERQSVKDALSGLDGGEVFNEAEVSVVTGLCFRCKKQGHVANDCVQGPTCYRCNKVGHISTKC